MIKYLQTNQKFNKGFITHPEAEKLKFRCLVTDTLVYVVIEGQQIDIDNWMQKVNASEMTKTSFDKEEKSIIKTGIQNRILELTKELGELNSKLGGM